METALSDIPLLSVMTFFPLLGALCIFFIAKFTRLKTDASKVIALTVSFVTFLLALAVFFVFDNTNPAFQLVERASWLPSFNAEYIRGIDGISLWFVMITAIITPIAILNSFGSIKKNIHEFMIAVLILETMMIGTFTSLDLVLFYVFFEGVLIPMFLIIGIWGGEKRIYATYKFFLYTLLGSLLMLVAVLYIAVAFNTTDMMQLIEQGVPIDAAIWIWLAFFASFAVKTPMFPFHTWLSYAHVEAPTTGSVLLAGILLKMGAYGFIRISLQMLPEAGMLFAPMMIVLSIIAIIYASFVAFAQTDMKKLIAYSSVAHMGFVTLGLFSMNEQGLDGAMFVILSHSFVSAALFMGVGVAYDRLHTREIARFGGMASNMPQYAMFFMIFTLAAVGLPGTSGFTGEFLSLLGAYKANIWIAVFAGLGIILGAVYMLSLYRRLFFGKQDKEDVSKMPDLSVRESLCFAPLAVLVFWIGLYPSTFSNQYSATMKTILERLVQ